MTENTRQMLGSEVGGRIFDIAYDHPMAATGVVITRVPSGTCILGYKRASALTGGTSPGVKFGTTPNGTELLAAGTTCVDTVVRLTADTTIYATVTGSPTGGAITAGITFCLPR